jgi:hypothetical protein
MCFNNVITEKIVAGEQTCRNNSGNAANSKAQHNVSKAFFLFLSKSRKKQAFSISVHLWLH